MNRTQLNIANGLREFAFATPHAPAVREGERVTTYAELGARTNRLATALLNAGLQPGDRVGVMMRNGLPWFDAIGGLAKAGLVQVPLNPRLSAPEVEYIVGHSQMRAMILEEELAEQAAPAIAAHGIEVIVSVGGTSLGRSYEEILAHGVDEDPRVPVDEYSPVTLCYTSGTTGRPKGVIISHRARVIASYLTALEWGLGPGRSTAAIAPMYHGAGFLFSWAAITTGAGVTSMNKFDPEELLRIVQRDAVNTMFLVPAHAALLKELGDAEIRRHDTSSIDTLYFNAAPLPHPLKLWVIDTFPGVGVHELYGSTETGIVSDLRPVDCLRKPRSVGTPFFMNEVRIVDAEGLAVEVGQEGELYNRSPMNMDYYLDDPEATAACTTDDGFVSAGDIARMDEDQCLYIVDRKKDVIISGGLNVYGREVEQALYEHPSIAAVAVIGTPSDTWGEVVTAIVVPSAAGQPATEELDAHCRARIAGYKLPRRYEFVKELPLNPSGKVLKRELRERFAEVEVAPQG